MGNQIMLSEKLTPELLARMRQGAELCARENRLMFINPALVMIPLLDELEALRQPKRAAVPEAEGAD